MTFFAPSVTPFVARLDKNGVPTLKVRAVDAAGVPYYAVFAAIPASGHLFAVAGAAVDAPSGFAYLRRSL